MSLTTKRPVFPYSPDELRIVDEVPVFRGTNKVRNTPVTSRRNAEALFFEKKPFYMPTIREWQTFKSATYHNTLGRGSGQDITDIFGIKWKYEPTAGGSIVLGGNPTIDEVKEWKDKLPMPDISGWGWEEEAQNTKLDPRFPTYYSCTNGFWFERLISFMDFMPAAMALIDDEQTEDLKELFAATTELGCKVIDKLCQCYPQMDFIEIHDDWGSQKAPFFSMDVAYELFVPYMKQLTDCIHSHGRAAMLHSCGCNTTRVQAYIDGGFDFWAPQEMNDIKKMYDEVGDKIVLGVHPEETNLAELPEEDQRRIAREFADCYNQPGKPTILSIAGVRRATPAFLDELYEYTRKLYLAR